jgi:hypothetical protein
MVVDNDPALVEDAVKYIIFLVDANTLFDVALGMYDFELVLMIAQYAQKACHILITCAIEHTDTNARFAGSARVPSVSA